MICQKETNMPKLSIVAPVYNVKDYLTRCTNSILIQSFKDFELILVDDGATDGSGEICDQIKKQDSRIKVIHKQNGGLSSARNAGIENANGDYITFVDSDDWIEPQLYEKMFESADKNDADITICRLQMVSEPNNVIKVVGYDKEIFFDKIEATKEILRDDMIPSYSCNKLFKRELFEGIRYPLGRIFEDTATIYKLFYKSNKVVTIPYIGYNYWQNPNGLCNNNNQSTEKNLTRELHNALAFDERYVFAKNNKDLNEVVPLCAFKAYQMIRSFIHMLKHKGYSLNKEQQKTVDDIMKTFDTNDLVDFTWLEKLDLYMYRLSKPMLNFYLSIIPIFHRMRE